MSLRLYVMADRYLVGSLREHAYEQFCNGVRHESLESTTFAALVDEAFVTTADGDDVQAFLCSTVAPHYWEVPVRENLRRIMYKNPGFAVGVLDRLADFMYR